MTLEAFKLLFAERPEAPEGVEFWEWKPMSAELAPDFLREAKRTRPRAESLRGGALVPLWAPGGPADNVVLAWDRATARVFYHAEREGALTA